MKNRLLLTVALISCLAVIGDAKVLATDPLTNLPLIPETSSNQYLGNEPTDLPKAMVCKSNMQGKFYSLYNITADAAINWYSSHLSGFKKARGYASQRTQAVFYKTDGTTIVVITSDRGPDSGSVKAYSVAYEQYQPGLSERTILGVTQGKAICP